MNYRLFPPQDLLTTRVQLPLSKSMSNRALIINALTEGAEPLDVFAQCDDTEAVRRALHDAEATAVNIGAAGSAMRFLTAYFATRQGRKVTIDGDERMRHRPIAPLVDALRQCGAEVSYVAEDGFPPLSVTGKQLQGGAVNIDGTISSQFVSALLMIAPTMQQGLQLTLEGEPASLPYVDLTIDMMQHAGIDVERIGNVITVKPGRYTDTLPPIEADWSAAAFWYELEAVTSGFITLDGLSADSAQGDRHVAEIYADLGVTTDFEPEEGGIDLLGSPDVSPRLILDLTNYPDLAQSVVVTCALIGVPFTITGLASLKIKETDRLTALATELAKMGVTAELTSDSITWNGRRRPMAAVPEFDTYGDHRMAMSLAAVAAYLPGIVIRDAEVVEKSYPQYWKHMQDAGFIVVDAALSMEEIMKQLNHEEE